MKETIARKRENRGIGHGTRSEGADFLFGGLGKDYFVIYP